MSKKFDTNPLDPDFPEKVKAAAAGNEFQTGQMSPPSVTEQETRRFNQTNFAAYSYQQGIPQTACQTAKLNVAASSSRKVDKVGLPENVLTALPYIPWYIGLVAGLLILIFLPKSEAKVRFHAAQGLAAHIGVLLVTTILAILGEIAEPANWGNGIFQIVSMVMLIIFAVKAWQGKPVHIESVDGLTNWLEDKIKPKE